MIFDRFTAAFHCTEDRSLGDKSSAERINAPTVQTVLTELGGKTFDGGLYRVLRTDEVSEATKAASLAFPELKERITVFGCDWLGIMFAADAGRLLEGVPQVLMLEVGAGEALQIPVDPIAFHNMELVDYPDDALAKSFYLQWQATTKEKLNHDQCAGYKVPLFLGGADEIDNLEIIDLSVYWHLCGQLRNKVKTLPEGQSISEIDIS